MTPIGMGLGGYIGDLLDKNIPLIYASCGGIMAILTIIAAMNRDLREYLAHDREIQGPNDNEENVVATDLA